eukprot:CAMPEP_0202733100 /NCGR_PEP_ID=MMETSP1385-20130828/187997_1 /ASSEMBLY_ACC=CAM_ASM_000861 /TAXON_ID=933848 /ORGANISM="Elphidium margaritaceum" /LENGTH=282 /DNA_ID=CAMNT_0049399427 /DNA_START=36 /DNA_END=884 /DNA_ORIENTATION=-
MSNTSFSQLPDDIERRCDMQRVFQSKKVLLGLLLFIIGAVLLGLSMSVVFEYNKWHNAVHGECMFTESAAISCTGTRGCDGWELGHQYIVHNASDAYERCDAVTYINEKETCYCNTAETPGYVLPSNADQEWHTCYVKQCDKVTFSLYTDSEYGASATMFGCGVFLVCISLPFCAVSKKRHKLSDDRDDHIDGVNQSLEELSKKSKSSKPSARKDLTETGVELAICSKVSTTTTTTSTKTNGVKSNHGLESDAQPVTVVVTSPNVNNAAQHETGSLDDDEQP